MPDRPRPETLIARRERLLGPNVTTFYRQPVHLVRGEGVWLWDAEGRRYLDCYNNVPHVGHGHPRVVEAIARQSATLNTHTRYLHEGILDYAERLAARLGGALETLLMVCTGSEANDVALRMGWAHTGRRGIIATDNTYHGNTELVSHLAANRNPIGGRADFVRLVPSPDSLHPLGGSHAAQPEAFAGHVRAAIDELEAAGHGVSSLVLCPFLANEGFPSVAPGFFGPAIEAVRAAGGIVIADEVQPGFGRLGSHFWGHQRAGFTPDVVTMGKPMANGYPAAAVVARREIMAAFRNAFAYFNTFGGNPVSCAAAMAVLDVLDEERLVPRAAETGAHALMLLRAIDHPLIADVRGAGLFLGVEFADAEGRPAGAFAAELVEAMRAEGVLLNRTGRHGNIIKIRPPMVFGREHARLMVETLRACLERLPLPEGAR